MNYSRGSNSSKYDLLWYEEVTKTPKFQNTQWQVLSVINAKSITEICSSVAAPVNFCCLLNDLKAYRELSLYDWSFPFFCSLSHSLLLSPSYFFSQNISSLKILLRTGKVEACLCDCKLWGNQFFWIITMQTVYEQCNLVVRAVEWCLNIDKTIMLFRGHMFEWKCFLCQRPSCTMNDLWPQTLGKSIVWIDWLLMVNIP